MQPFQSLVRDVEQSMASGEDSRRVETLRRLTTLFIEQSPNLGEDHVGVFDEVISRLAGQIEFRARVELAERLADIENAPKKTVRDLAFDEDIAVARPVIERSVRLDESDLLAIASERGQGHMLAMSGRRDLTAAVTDVLVVRGDETVLRKVARNDMARFSETGFGTMVKRAEADQELQSILTARPDIPVHHVNTLIQAAKEVARREMMVDLSGSEDMLRQALEVGAQAVAEGGGEVAAIDFTGCSARVDAMEAAGELSEDKVQKLLKEDRLADAIVAIGRLAQLSTEVVANAYSAPSYDPLLFIVRGARMGWPTFKLLLNAKSGKAAPQPLLKAAFASFEGLSVPTAQRVMRFVSTRSKIKA
jgi:uncharacterized protein (DUF2336 family)